MGEQVLIRIHYPDGGTERIRYDANGVVVKCYVYDAHGNIIREMDGEGYASAENDGDHIGTLCQYNAIGGLTEKREPVKQEEGRVRYRLTRYRYDLVGNMT